MTPDQLTAAAAIASIIQSIGAWPVGLVVMVVVLGPWVINLFIALRQAKNAQEHDRHSAEMVAVLKEEFSKSVATYEKRFESVVVMYEKNVVLVQDNQSMANELITTIRLNTQVLTQLSERIK